ncbi:MAG: OmpA family protein [Rhodospirillaceae bacterium]
MSEQTKVPPPNDSPSQEAHSESAHPSPVQPVPGPAAQLHNAPLSPYGILHHGAPPVKRSRRPRYWGAPAADDGVIDVWLMSYADMVTLLMTVFVVLVLLAGTSKPEANGGPGKYEGIRGFLNNIFELRAMSPYSDEGDYVVVGLEGNKTGLTPERRAGLSVIKRQDLDRIQRRLDTLEHVKQELEKARLGDYIKAEAAGDGIRIDIPNPVVFGVGGIDIAPTGLALLRALAPILSSGDFSIAVEGHTDNSAVADLEHYPSNWELSSARAAAVVRFLIGAGVDPSRLGATGYADTKPLVKNDTVEHRAQNGRVTFLLRY